MTGGGSGSEDNLAARKSKLSKDDLNCHLLPSNKSEEAAQLKKQPEVAVPKVEYASKTTEMERRRTELRVLARKKLEEEKRKLEQGLAAKDNVDPLSAVIPDVVIRDHLLKYLEVMLSPEDKQNLCRVSPLAAKLLEPTKWSWRFQEIFRIPNFRDLFSKKKLLNLRLISKDWRNSVDNIWEVENAESDFDLYHTDYKSILKSSFTLAEYGQRKYQRKLLSLQPNFSGSGPSSTKKLAKFVDESLAHPEANPFLSRAATFSLFSEINIQDEMEFSLHEQFVLDKFGSELRSLQLIKYSRMPAPQLLYKIEESLKLAHQLCSLELTLFSLLFSYDPQTNLHCFSEFFPPLPNLTRLAISHGAEWPIYQSLSGYFDQLVSVDFRKSEKFMEWYQPGTLHSTFPSLKHFAFCINDEEELSKLSLMTSPLFEVDLKSNSSNTCLAVIFHSLHQFKETLSALKIQQHFHCGYSLKTLEYFELPKSAQIQLPRLKLLSVNIPACAQLPLDLLLKLEAPLEYLELVGTLCPDHPTRVTVVPGRNDRLKIYEYYWDNMYASNVWELMPYLQEVHVVKSPTLMKYKRSQLRF